MVQERQRRNRAVRISPDVAQIARRATTTDLGNVHVPDRPRTPYGLLALCNNHIAGEFDEGYALLILNQLVAPGT